MDYLVPTHATLEEIESRLIQLRDVFQGELPDHIESYFDTLILFKKGKIDLFVCFFKTKEKYIEDLKHRLKLEIESLELLNEYIIDLMHSSNLDKLEGFNYSVVKRMGPPAVQVVDESQIPDDFFTEKVEVIKKLDKQKLKEYLKFKKCEGALLMQHPYITFKGEKK